MHFFNSRFKPLFEIRNARAQSKHFKLNQRLKNIIAIDAFECFYPILRKDNALTQKKI